MTQLPDVLNAAAAADRLAALRGIVAGAGAAAAAAAGAPGSDCPLRRGEQPRPHLLFLQPVLAHGRG